MLLARLYYPHVPLKLPPLLLSHFFSFIHASLPHQISQFAMFSLKQLPVAVAFTGEQIELLPACPIALVGMLHVHSQWLNIRTITARDSVTVNQPHFSRVSLSKFQQPNSMPTQR